MHFESAWLGVRLHGGGTIVTITFTNETAPYRGILLFIINCVDVDECSSDTNECDPNALCTNVEGSYVCRCKKGFTGNGSTCTGMYIHKRSVNFTNLYFRFEGRALAK